MKTKPLPSVEYLRSCFSYDPETGVVTWKWRYDVPNKVNGRFAGTPTGAFSKGHLVTKLNGVSYSTHRLIWALVTGETPEEGEIDHRDGVKANNKWNNLRRATSQQNKFNVAARSRSGYKGVYYQKGSWYAQIMIFGKRTHLGTFPTPELANEAYCRFADLHHGDFAYHRR